MTADRATPRVRISGLDKRPGSLIARLIRLLDAEGHADAEVIIAFVKEPEQRRLNKRHRGIDETTDVLSFPLEPGSGSGEMYVDLDRARSQAKEGGWALGMEVHRLCVHGALHLCGYDHHSAKDAAKMRAAEIKYLGNAPPMSFHED